MSIWIQLFVYGSGCHSQVNEEISEEGSQIIETVTSDASESGEDGSSVETMIIDFDPTEIEGLIVETQQTSEDEPVDESEFEKNNLYDPHVMEEKTTYGSYLQ